MKINNKILEKFNRYQDEIIKYYGLNIHVHIATFAFGNKMHQINGFNIVTLGYKLSELDSGVNDGYMSSDCLSNRLAFLRESYPLLTAFYALYAYFTQDKIVQKTLRILSDTLKEINENVEYVRRQKGQNR